MIVIISILTIQMLVSMRQHHPQHPHHIWMVCGLYKATRRPASIPLLHKAFKVGQEFAALLLYHRTSKQHGWCSSGKHDGRPTTHAQTQNAQTQNAQTQNSKTHSGINTKFTDTKCSNTERGTNTPRYKKRERHGKITGPYQTLAGTLMVESRTVRMWWSTLIFSQLIISVFWLLDIRQKTLGSYDNWIHVWEFM